MKKSQNPKDILNSLEEKINKNQLDEAEIEKISHKQEDHYHGYHHFDRQGNHDDISSNEFKIKSFFTFSKRSLIFKISLTGVFLALSLVMGSVDIVTEMIHIPLNDQVWMTARFLDVVTLALAVACLGPIFSLFVAGLSPILHNVIHGGEHGWIMPAFDVLLYMLIVVIIFLIYNILFKNSPIHRDENKKLFNFKRWAPIPIIVIIVSICSTLFFILALYVTGDHDHGHTQLVSEALRHEHDEGIEFANVDIKVAFAIFGWSLLRFSLAFSLFAVIEPKIRVINHRYK